MIFIHTGRRCRVSPTNFMVLSLLLLLSGAIASAQDRFLSTGGPYGGPVARLLAGGAGEFFTIASGFQLFATSDNGASWRPLSIGPEGELPPTVQLLAFDSAGTLHAAGAGDVWSSGDRGGQWSARSAGYPGVAPDNDRQSRRLEAGRNGTLYHVVEYRRLGRAVLYRKKPGGEWTELLFPEPGENRFRSMTVLDNGVLLVGTAGGVWRSTNEGTGWTLEKGEIGAGDTVTALAGDDTGRVWAWTQPIGLLYHSTDRGVTWTSRPYTGLPPNVSLTDMAVGRAETLIVTSMSGAYRSTNGGLGWSSTGDGLSRPDGFTPPRVVISRSTGEALVALGDLYGSSDDGATWHLRNHGLTGSITISLVEGRDGTILCGTPGRLYRSRDRGESWERTGEGLPGGGLVYVLAAESDGTLFASVYGQGLYRSTDNGTTWSAANQGLVTNRILGILPSRGGKIYLATYDGVFRSTDRGATWHPSSNGIPVERIEAIAEAPGGMLFVAAYGAGIYASSDSGATWVDRSVGLADPRVSSIHITPSGVLLLGTEQNGIFRSTDSARRWWGVSEGAGSRGARMTRGWATDRNGVHYATSDGGVLRSTDDGLTWRGGIFPYLLGNTGAQPAALSIIATTRGDLFSTSLGGGVLRLRLDSVTRWERVTSGPSEPVRRLWTHELYLSGIHPVFAATAGSLNRFGFIVDAAPKWDRLDSGLADPSANSFVYDPRSNDMLVATSSGIYRQNVFAVPPRSWQRSSQGLPPGAVRSLAFNPIGGVFFAGTATGLYRSTDGGTGWTVSGGAGAGGVEAIIVTGSGRVIVAHELGVFRSDDNGGRWLSARNGLPFVSVTGFAIAGGTTIYAGTAGSGIYRSTDDGQTWTPTIGSLPNTFITALAVSPSGAIHAGTERGSFRSSDGGASWRGTIPFVGRINAILVANEGRVWIATEGGGLYRSSIESGVTVVPEVRSGTAVTAPAIDFHVRNSRVIVEFTDAARRPRRVTLHDLRGGEIRSIAPVDEGASRLEIDLAGLSTGVYLVRVVTDGGVVSMPIAIRR